MPASALLRPHLLRLLPGLLPGLLLAGLLAALAQWLAGGDWLQRHGLGALTLAIVLGMLVGNTLYPRLAARADAGVGLAKAQLLRAGIVLYGLRLTFQDIAQVGLAGVLIDTLVLASTFTLAWWVGTRVLKLERDTALLVGAGSSICGAAAVMAAAPVVRGRSDQVTVAVATVVVFGTVAMFGWPALYQLAQAHGWLAISSSQYGVFAGSTVHEVAQVVVAGRAVGEQAAATAVITKMVRVMLLAPCLLLVSALLTRRADGVTAADAPGARSGIVVPWFAFGFIAVAALHSLLPLPAWLVSAGNAVDTALLAMAMAALGLTTQAAALRRAGLRPLLLAALLCGWLLGGGLAINLAVRALLE